MADKGKRDLGSDKMSEDKKNEAQNEQNEEYFSEVGPNKNRPEELSTEDMGTIEDLEE